MPKTTPGYSVLGWLARVRYDPVASPLFPLFAPKPNRESAQPDNCERTGPHCDLGATCDNGYLENESRDVEQDNE